MPGKPTERLRGERNGAMYLEHDVSMMFGNDTKARALAPQAGADQEIPVILFGRFMRADRSEYACRVKHISLERAEVHCDAEVAEGERIVAYLDDLGRIEGDVESVAEGQFQLRLRLSPAGRERLAKKIDWVRRKARGEGVEKRRFERYRPREAKSCITMSDGREYPCEIIDISVSGAAVKAGVLPAVGSVVMLGRTRGRVVRHFAEGFAVEFVRLLPMEQLKEKIR